MAEIGRVERSKQLLVGSADAVGALLGWMPPRAPNTTATAAGGMCLWLRPDQWLLIGGATIAAQSADAHVLDVDARWVTFTIRGADAAGLLNAGCSLDLREHVFAAGRCAQTRIEQVPVILHRREPHEFDVLVERPLAHHFERWLREAALDFQ
jgi:sarcosine oxidase, subunit gamma